MQQIKELPIEQRPYEKCFNKGAEFLSNSELLSVILRSGTQGINAYQLANMILSQGVYEDDLLYIMHCTKEDLLSLKGIGKVKAVQIMCIGELAKRISGLNAKKQLQFKEPVTIANYYMEQLRHLEQEQLIILYLNTKCQLIKDKIISTGTINQTIISPREIFIYALRYNAVSIILIHNHPSGDATPSKDDIASTKRIIQAGNVIGISILDHIIIGDKRYYSFKQSNLI